MTVNSSVNERAQERVWQRVQRGQHAVAIGFSPAHPPASLRVVRTSCDVPRTTLGPIADAQRKVAVILDHESALISQARELVVSGLRRRLLGDVPAESPDTALVDVCNRLAGHQPPHVLLFDAVDAADDATCNTLRRILERPGWLALPVILVFRSARLEGEAARLLDSLRAGHGDDAIIESESESESESEQRGEAEKTARFDWRELPADVRQVLRAGAVIGSGFEADLVAALLDRSPLYVLDCLQRAADAGAPIEDRGEERFFLPEAAIASLRASILPSLCAAWHRKLGLLLAAAADVTMGRVAAPTSAPALSPAQAASDQAAGTSGASAMHAMHAMPTMPAIADVAPQAAEREDEMARFFAEVFAGDQEPQSAAPDAVTESAPTVPVAQPDETARRVERRTRTTRAPGRNREPTAEARQAGAYRDEARAASHLNAAGQIEAAAERYATAAGQAAASGAYAQAMDHGRQALQLIEELPASPARRQFRIQLLTALGRLQWQAAGAQGGVGASPSDASFRHGDAAFTLKSALVTADAALSSCDDDTPGELVAEVRELIAGVCYDLGDQQSLERALDELTRASRLLLDSEQRTAAARLLNDQAAVYVRLGDPVRASYLLSQSQTIFEDMAKDDPVAIEELAETHHLIARLPLHAQIRTGRESDAFSMALEQARIAERNYRQLQAGRELARVWETMGRLELARGRLDQATRRLSSALQVQSQEGDLTGLARSTAALSEVLAASGKHRDALTVLGDSLLLNHEKGSPIGLAFNRRAFDALCQQLEDKLQRSPELASEIAEFAQRLQAAEATLGRIDLPPSA